MEIESALGQGPPVRVFLPLTPQMREDYAQAAQ